MRDSPEMARPLIKTERPEELTSPHKGSAKTRRKMNDTELKDPHAPQIKIKRSTDETLTPHPSTLFDCSQHLKGSASWKEDGMKVTFRYVKTMTDSSKV